MGVYARARTLFLCLKGTLKGTNAVSDLEKKS